MTPNAAPQSERDVVFISKGTPDDDQFVLWLAPRLEVQGYNVFADILSLEPGDRWRREITGTPQNQNNAIKMLLCCSGRAVCWYGTVSHYPTPKDVRLPGRCRALHLDFHGNTDLRLNRRVEIDLHGRPQADDKAVSNLSVGTLERGLFPPPSSGWIDGNSVA